MLQVAVYVSQCCKLLSQPTSPTFMLSRHNASLLPPCYGLPVVHPCERRGPEEPPGLSKTHLCFFLVQQRLLGVLASGLRIGYTSAG